MWTPSAARSTSGRSPLRRSSSCCSCPVTPFFSSTLEKDPSLQEYAISKNVLIATPTSLIGLLRTVAFAWTQAALQDNLKQVYELGRELYDRLSVMGGHLNALGKSLDRSVKSYNDTIGSMEGRVMVTARKFRTLKVVESKLLELKGASRPRGRSGVRSWWSLPTPNRRSGHSHQHQAQKTRSRARRKGVERCRNRCNAPQTPAIWIRGAFHGGLERSS
ncbi:DNA recombination protein RmuC [Nonomuraea ferruginea]